MGGNGDQGPAAAEITTTESAPAQSAESGAGAPAEGPRAAALPDRTRMGAVTLVTDDLAPMRAFYVDAVGLEVLAETDTNLSLGVEGAEIIAITRAAGRAADVQSEAGLYHSAILFPDAPALARVLANIAEVAPGSYGGSADHAVSLAFYFADPDGNGVELYVDTPREGWVWEDGLVQMGSAALDPNAFLTENLEGPSTGTATMGHVHLRVGDLEQAREFYADTLGFAVTAESGGALFYAAGGYHHHLATNTWGSQGAGERPASLGLRSLVVDLGDKAALDGVVARLTGAGVDFTRSSGEVRVEDPWGNVVRLVA